MEAIAKFDAKENKRSEAFNAQQRAFDKKYGSMTPGVNPLPKSRRHPPAKEEDSSPKVSSIPTNDKLVATIKNLDELGEISEMASFESE